jgi:hypothetical protein
MEEDQGYEKWGLYWHLSMAQLGACGVIRFLLLFE